MYPRYEVFRTESGILIYPMYEDSETIDALYDNPTLIDKADITLYPTSKVGPYEGIIELYRRQSLLSSPDDYRWQLFDMNLSELELEIVHKELVILAQNDPWLSRFNPGAPEQLSFLPVQFSLSLIKIASYFGLPAILAWLIRYTNSHTKDAIIQSRQSAGLCIHCTYDCTNLPTPTCPECGQLHRICALE